MPQITSVLENEPGIQYDHANDKTGGSGIAPINNVIVGKFKRGRTDQLLNITKQNIRAVLGFDPTNLSYVAVQDALDTNIPSVKVFRVVDTGVCEPVGININGNAFPLYPNAILHIDYRVNGGPMQRYTWNHSQPQSQQINYVATILNEFLETFVSSNIVVTGGGGLTYFQRITDGVVLAAASDEVIEPDPINITLYSVAGQSNDPVMAMFNAPQFTLHSCGKKNWQGI